jgi:hypothetical protein
VVNVECLCPAAEAAARFHRRARHPGHLDAGRTLDQVRESIERLAPLGLIPGLPRLPVDTRSEPDLDALLARIANTPEPEPACSFCGARPPAELIRAGGRPFFICSTCVEQPRLEDPVTSDALCAFCELPLTGTRVRAGTVRRVVAVSRRSLMLCDECVRVCVQILAEDRRARRGYWGGWRGRIG